MGQRECFGSFRLYECIRDENARVTVGLVAAHFVFTVLAFSLVRASLRFAESSSRHSTS